jgi:pyruvate-ferredoxin/flavodoxin oxidoreductase
MELPMTFADFAATEGRFGKQFRKAPPETWNDDMVPVADFLKLGKDEREGKFPFIWAVDQKRRLMRLLLTEDLVRATEERLAFWKQLKDVAGVSRAAVDTEMLADRVRAELIQKITASLGVGGGDGAAANAPQQKVAQSAAPAADGYEPVWVESPECTACDECTSIAPKVFVYNDQKQAIVVNPKGARYADLVKAAEKCTAGCLHPGTPWNMNEPGIEKLMARAAKYN